MQPSHIQLVALLSASFPLAAAARNNATTPNAGRPIIIDTDLMSDVDDVGSLAVANVLHNCGVADLRGVVINTHSRYGALAANALCAYYGNGDVPIAGLRPLTNETFLDTFTFSLGEYASKVAYNWPRTIDNASTTPDPVELYRSILDAAADRSVHIISIGFLTNLADLLRSEADDTSSMSGRELLSTKTAELVVMGGYYPSGWEFNFGGEDPESTAYVVEHWPKDVPITYSGGELGGVIFSGHGLASHAPPDSPILAAYQWYVGRCATARESWDPLTTLYGILGLDGFAQLGIVSPLVFANEHGYNRITSSNGSNAWVDDASVTNQHYLRLAEGVSNASVAWLLDQFYTHDPIDERCFG